MAIRVGISDAAACSICADPNVKTLSGSMPANRLRDHHEIIHQTGAQRSENALPACQRVARWSPRCRRAALRTCRGLRWLWVISAAAANCWAAYASRRSLKFAPTWADLRAPVGPRSGIAHDLADLDFISDHVPPVMPPHAGSARMRCTFSGLSQSIAGHCTACGGVTLRVALRTNASRRPARAASET